MTDSVTQIDTESPNVACQTARTTVTVTGIFSVIFLGFLAWNFIGSSILGPRLENRMILLKTQLPAGSATDEQLAEIRQIDLKIRTDRLWRLDFARKTAYILLGSLTLFLIAGKLASLWSKTLPNPGHAQEFGEAQRRQARGARWAIAAVAVLLGGGVAALIAVEKPAVPTPAEGAIETGPAYATMAEKQQQWHRFRGPGGAGVSHFTNIPTQWDGASGQNITWKTEVPLTGHNSPIVWENHVFLSGANEEKRQVYCFDATSGQLLWTGDVSTSPAVAEAELDIMEDTGLAACSMATDGKRVYAIFATGDMAAFDFHGRQVWARNLGVPDSMYGYASSLDTYQDRVIVQYDQGDGTDGKSHLYALEGATGDVVWDSPRPIPNSWTSPIVVEVEGQPLVFTVTDPWVFANSAVDGKEIWRAECVSGDVAPSPIYAGGLVIATEPYSQVVAIKADGQGNVTDTHVAWHMEDAGPDICCPVADEKYVYILEGHGVLFCCNLIDGTIVYEQDISEDFMASPSMVDGKLYLLTNKGVMHIAQAGPEYKELAACKLGEACHASPAFVNGRIYIRGIEHLYCISQGPAGNPKGESAGKPASEPNDVSASESAEKPAN